MATEITLPELGDGIESGDILEVFISVGDTVSEGDEYFYDVITFRNGVSNAYEYF